MATKKTASSTRGKDKTPSSGARRPSPGVRSHGIMDGGKWAGSGSGTVKSGEGPKTRQLGQTGRGAKTKTKTKKPGKSKA